MGLWDRVRGLFNVKPLWSVSQTDDIPRFLRALPALVPESSVLHFEGSPDAELAECLARLSSESGTQVRRATIWPPQRVCEVPVNHASMETLAALFDGSPERHLCYHCHMYHEGEALITWYDAFDGQSIWLSKRFDEAAVRDFADRLGSVIET